MKIDQPSKETCELVDRRDSYRCVRCGVSLYTTYGARHHRKLRSHSYGQEKHSASNLIDLCESCHGWVHAHPEESYENGWMVHGWDNPTLVPVTVGGNGRFLLDDYGKARNVTGVVADSLL